MSELKQAIEEVRVLLEGEECPKCDSGWVEESLTCVESGRIQCSNCNGTGLDPDYAQFLELFRREEIIVTECGGGSLTHKTGHYVTRLDWLDLPEGALAGAIASKQLLSHRNLKSIFYYGKPEDANLAAVLALKEVLGGS